MRWIFYVLYGACRYVSILKGTTKEKRIYVRCYSLPRTSEEDAFYLPLKGRHCVVGKSGENVRKQARRLSEDDCGWDAYGAAPMCSILGDANQKKSWPLFPVLLDPPPRSYYLAEHSVQIGYFALISDMWIILEALDITSISSKIIFLHYILKFHISKITCVFFR
jgi:hypothetical protein